MTTTTKVIIGGGAIIGAYLLYTKVISPSATGTTIPNSNTAKPAGTGKQATGGGTTLTSILANGNLLGQASTFVSGLFGSSSSDGGDVAVSSPNLPAQAPIQNGADQNLYPPDVVDNSPPTATVDSTAVDTTLDSDNSDFFDGF